MGDRRSRSPRRLVGDAVLCAHGRECGMVDGDELLQRGLGVLALRGQDDDVMAVLVEPPADRPADRPGTVNEETHRQMETRLRHPSMRRLAIDMFDGNTGASSAVNQWASAISVPSTVISPDTYRAPKPIMSWCGNGHG